jgi:hypothetical protein
VGFHPGACGYCDPMQLWPPPGPSDLLRQVDRASRFLDEVARLVPRAAALLDAAEALLARADALADRVELTRSGAQAEIRRFAELLDAVVDRVTPADLAAFARVARRLDDVVPAVESMASVGPDIRELTAVAKELDEIVGRVPGMGRIKRKVAEDQDFDSKSDGSSEIM